MLFCGLQGLTVPITSLDAYDPTIADESYSVEFSRLGLSPGHEYDLDAAIWNPARWSATNNF